MKPEEDMSVQDKKRAAKRRTKAIQESATWKGCLYDLTSRIPDPVIRAFTIYVLDSAPRHFWTNPASAGKYHPDDEHGFGGLVLHTIRVTNLGLFLCESRPDLSRNTILSACILHDICRYGDTDTSSQYSLKEHPELAARLIRRLSNSNNVLVAGIANAVETHTGRWGKVGPRNETEWIVHYADCIAATREL